FAEWGIYAREYFPKDIPADKLTHVKYAFAGILDGKIAFHEETLFREPYAAHKNLPELAQLKAEHPHLKVCISVGGWSLSKPFPQMASAPEGRSTLVTSVRDFLIEYPLFDCIDIDWEYPVVGVDDPNPNIAYVGLPEDGA